MQSYVGPVVGAIFIGLGVRLAMKWWQTGGAPEGLLSIFFTGFGIGAPSRLYSAAHAKDLDPSSLEGILIGFTGLVALTGAAAALVLFTRLVFRPESHVAKLWTGLSLIIYAVITVGMMMDGNGLNQFSPFALFGNFWATTAFWWTFIECTLFYFKMRRQATLGLGDPVVCNRFLLWTVWTGAFALLPTLTFSIKASMMLNVGDGEVLRTSEATLNTVRLFMLATGVASLGSIWLSFFPPSGYVERVRTRAAKA